VKIERKGEKKMGEKGGKIVKKMAIKIRKGSKKRGKRRGGKFRGGLKPDFYSRFG